MSHLPAWSRLALLALFTAAFTLVLPGLAWASGGPFIDRQAAIDSLLAHLDPNDPDSLTTAVFFYNYDSPTDSVLAPGTVVTDFDSTMSYTLPCETYFFFIDYQVDMFWGHRAEFVFVDAPTGTVTAFPVTTWPLFDGVDFLRFLEDGDASGELILGGGYPPPPPPGTAVTAPGAPPPFEPRFTEQGAQSPGQTQGLIIAGLNIHKKADETAIKGDAARAEQLMPSGIPITKIGLGLPTGTGGTNQEICNAINAMPKNCKKLHVFYVGHGEKGYMVTRKSANPLDNGKLTYEKLACKLIENGAQEVCITIMACKSGSAIKKMTITKPVNGKPTGLKGTLITSSSASLPTVREPDGSAFLRNVVACQADVNGDLNQDGKRPLIEAVVWAGAQDTKVSSKKPQATTLGGGGVITLGAPYRVLLPSNEAKAGTDLIFELEVVFYEVPKDGDSDGELVGRGRLYVKNPTSRNVKARKTVEVICFDAKGVEISRHAVTPHLEANARWCFTRVDPKCRKIKVVEKTNKPGVQNTAVAFFQDVAQGGPRFTRYSRGEFIFEDDLILSPPGQIHTLSVAPVPGWDLVIDPPLFTMPAELDSQLVTVVGTMPDTATTGGFIDLTYVNTATGDTTTNLIHAMLFDSLSVPVGDGFGFIDQSLDTELGMFIPSGFAFFERSVLNVLGNTTCEVAPGGGLAAFFSAVCVDSAVTCPFVVTDGIADLNMFGLVNAANGMELNGAVGAVLSSASYRSQGDGLTLSGDVSGLFVDGFDIEGSAGNGLVLDGTPPLLLPNIQIVNSGVMDVVARNVAEAELLNCEFDGGLVDVEPGSRVTRSWTALIGVETAAGDSVPNAAITVVNALGDTVYGGVTDSIGLAGGAVLTEWVNDGGLVTPHNPHTITVEAVEGDTTVVYDALTRGVIFIVLPTSTTGSGDDPVGAGFFVRQNRPNPFASQTSIAFRTSGRAPADLTIYDVRGREVHRRTSPSLGAGDHVWQWQPPRNLPNGVYFYRLRHGSETVSRKMILSR